MTSRSAEPGLVVEAPKRQIWTPPKKDLSSVSVAQRSNRVASK